MDGYKLYITVGNPSYIVYLGFTLEIDYAPPRPDSISLGEWVTWIRRKSVKYVKNLPAGTWTGVELILAPARYQELEYLLLSISVDRILLQYSR